jgi:hypothetical protein
MTQSSQGRGARARRPRAAALLCKFAPAWTSIDLTALPENGLPFLVTKPCVPSASEIFASERPSFRAKTASDKLLFVRGYGNSRFWNPFFAKPPVASFVWPNGSQNAALLGGLWS